MKGWMPTSWFISQPAEWTLAWRARETLTDTVDAELKTY